MIWTVQVLEDQTRVIGNIIIGNIIQKDFPTESGLSGYQTNRVLTILSILAVLELFLKYT